MLGVKTISGVFLDLSPNTSVQLQRKSPFFEQDSLAEEYSLPLTFKYTPKNARELGLQTHFYTRRIRKVIEGVQLYDGNNFCYVGDLIITSASGNINAPDKGSITGFFQTGVSSFFNAVKGKKLRELQLGGPRPFAWTNNDPTSTAAGFWQHIHQTLDGLHEYSFAPIRDEMWSGSTDDGTAEWINKLNDAGALDYAANVNTLAPQVSLKYLLQQTFEEHGWSFDFSRMDDQTWQTLFLPSFYSVTWKRVIQTLQAPYFDTAPLPTITINLQNHVPPEMLITNFIIALRNRYNWGFEFDAGRRVASIFPLRGLANGVRKNWTPYMPAGYDSDFSEEVPVVAFKNEIDSNDGLATAPDFKKITPGAPVFDFMSLPVPDENNFLQVVYCWKENQYYQCHYDETGGTYSWDLYASGIYNYEPDGTNQDITTEASTMPVYRTLYRPQTYQDYYGLFPYCLQEGNWEGKKGDFVAWGLRLLFHRGLVWEGTASGLKGQQKYPYLTSICTTYTQEEPDLPWSNVYTHTLQGVDRGIIPFWWYETMKFLGQSEVQTLRLALPRRELKAFSWSDVILLRNIPYIVQELPEQIPYPGYVEAKLRRIG